MPPTAEAYKRYLKKFDEQETEIEQFQETIKKLPGPSSSSARPSTATWAG